jgi:hypothetical protein
MRDLKRAVDTLDGARIVKRVHEVALGVCRSLSGHDLAEDEAHGFAFMHSPRLGLGLWFADEVKSRSLGQDGGLSAVDAELLEIEAALGVYFLASYQESPEEA